MGVSRKTSKYIILLGQNSSSDFYQGWDVRIVEGEERKKNREREKRRKIKIGREERKERKKKTDFLSLPHTFSFFNFSLVFIYFIFCRNSVLYTHTQIYIHIL